MTRRRASIGEIIGTTEDVQMCRGRNKNWCVLLRIRWIAGSCGRFFFGENLISAEGGYWIKWMCSTIRTHQNFRPDGRLESAIRSAWEIAVSSPWAHDKMLFCLDSFLSEGPTYQSVPYWNYYEENIGGNAVRFEPRFISSSTLALYPLGSWNWSLVG